ncbi:hypothetical protein E4Z66_05270 [Aliishimia ponticola]|uniref:Invasion associated locus B family protein n=1 Tax=Aliishimia ponticola TaxID=2499833 RepID=A0A4S4NH51_9RHOB|nr:invasion associated locus B family protein [Aliishimia ponticola]THH38969.1 hypothetical protein E4Z66_05270 [Aliishimia ponticola]
MRKLFVAGLLSLATFPTLSAAQEQSGGWIPKCDDTKCTMARELNRAEDGKRVATFFAVKQIDSGAIRLGVALPLGILLEPGVRFDLDGTALDLPFEVCFPDGCRAQRVFTPEELEKVEGADEISVRFFAYGSANPVSIVMPVDGMLGAFDQ